MKSHIKFILLKFSLIVLTGLVLNGCPPTMEPSFEGVQFLNSSSREVKTLLNLTYPDSSFERVVAVRSMKAGDSGQVGTFFDLKRLPGLTFFVIDHAYYWSQFEEIRPFKPSDFLSEDSVLARYVLSKQQLDSLNWRIEFP